MSDATLKICLWLVFIMAGAVLVVGSFRGESTLRDYLELRKSREVLAETVGDLHDENKALAEEIVRLKKSPKYAKKVLRDKYHLTEPDEKIIFFSD